MANHEIESYIPLWLQNSSQYFVVVINHVKEIQYVNPYFKQQFNFPDNNDSNFVKLLYPRNSAEVHKVLTQCFARPQDTYTLYIDNQYDIPIIKWECSGLLNTAKETIGVIFIGHVVRKEERQNQYLQEKSKRVDSIIEDFSDGFFVVDRMWKFIKVNQVFLELMDKEKTEVIETEFWDLFPKEKQLLYPVFFEKAFYENKTQRFEEYFKFLNKRFRVLIYPSVEGLTVFLRDVSNENILKEQLIDSENKLKAMLNSSVDSAILISKDFKILLFNSVARQMAHNLFKKEMEVGSSFWEFVAPNSEEQFLQSFSKALDGELVEYDSFRTLANKEGKWFHVRYIPVYNAKKEIIGIALNTINISERIKTEQKLQSILDSTTENNIMLSTDYKVVSFNRTAKENTKKILGKEIKDGDNILSYIDDSERKYFLKAFDKAKSGGILTFEKAVLFGSDEKWIRIQYYPVRDAHDKVVAVSLNINDIHTQKLNELKIVLQNKKLKKIAFIQAHVLRRPVASILGLSQLIQVERETYTGEPILFEYLDYLEKAVKELDEAVNDIGKRTYEITD